MSYGSSTKQEIRRRGLKIAVAGIPKTIDNDIPVIFILVLTVILALSLGAKLTLSVLFMFQVIDKSFGFDTAVEEAQRAINAAHVEAESIENGIGVVKLMGRYSGTLQHHLFYDLLTTTVMYFNSIFPIVIRI